MTKRPVGRRKYRTPKWFRQSGKRIDRVGMVSGRLLYLECLGFHGKSRHLWWRALCDCGRECEVRWRPGTTTSCGCANEEANRQRDFSAQREDGTWGQANLKRLTLPDGTETTVRDLARRTGLSLRAAANRVERWPAERWLDPVQYTGKRASRRKELIRQKMAELPGKRKQPWSKVNIRKAQEANRARSQQAQPLPPDRQEGD